MIQQFYRMFISGARDNSDSTVMEYFFESFFLFFQGISVFLLYYFRFEPIYFFEWIEFYGVREREKDHIIVSRKMEEFRSIFAILDVSE